MFIIRRGLILKIECLKSFIEFLCIYLDEGKGGGVH